MYRRLEKHNSLNDLGEQFTSKQLLNYVYSFIYNLIALFSFIIFIYYHYQLIICESKQYNNYCVKLGLLIL